jgi:hypothetical protein
MNWLVRIGLDVRAGGLPTPARFLLLPLYWHEGRSLIAGKLSSGKTACGLDARSTDPLADALRLSTCSLWPKGRSSPCSLFAKRKKLRVAPVPLRAFDRRCARRSPEDVGSEGMSEPCPTKGMLDLFFGNNNK